VSRALNNNPRLSQETRDRVNELARSLNYSINVGAQIMRGKPMQTVAVAFPYHPEHRQHFKDPFFLATIGSIGDALIDRGYNMLIVGVEAARFDQITQPYETGQAVGTILLGQEGQHRRLNELAVRGMPMVVWGARLKDQLYCTVGSDNVMGGYQATDHLLATGARRVAFFGDRELAEMGHRYDGYVAAHQARGVPLDPALYRPVPFVTADIRREVERMVREERLAFDAVFACGDVMALQVMATLHALGLEVPGDVRVVGYDDLSLAADSNPPLSTIRQSVEAAGKGLVDLLLAKLRGEAVESIVMPTEFVGRASSAVVR
jgi:DNA-binding LacI/PurR family transcriptional regulator